MSLTRRNWFLHRVAPAGALFGAAAASGATPALAASGNGKKSTLDKTLRLHPLLQVAAQQEPDKKISVIVTKRKNAKGGAHSDEIAKAHGSSVKSDFDNFIRAFEMEVQAKRLPQLAKHPKVAMVSPNTKLRYNAISTASLKTAFNQTINVPAIWNGTTPATGLGVTVCVLDSGIRENHTDFSHGNVESMLINPRATGRNDKNGHGTHVAGIIKGKDSLGRYIGVAPDCNLIGIQIADDTGACREADLIRALKWVNENKTVKNIKVVNLSLNGAVPSSYLTNPICAAVETLMMRGVSVIVAAGNRGSVSNAVQFAPANDPHIITCGALDDNETIGTSDDSCAPFSSRGVTLDGHQKPDVVAPGRKIVAALSSTSCTLAQQFPERIVDSKYIRLSGTSMAAPVLAGVVALLYERFPNLKPAQVKWLLTQTMKSYPGQVGSAGVVDVPALFARAAQGNIGETGAGIPFNNTVAEGMASVQMQNSATYWDATYWDATYWDATYWDATYWDATYWDAAAFDNTTYEMFTDL